MSRDRDQQLDQALKQELRAMSTTAEDHVDPETLAAWADGGLDTSAMALVESHVSSCPRCQSIAGVMARSAPVVAAEPRRAFRLPAWWIPIAAGVAAVTMWMVVPGQRQIATAPPAPPAAAVQSIAPAAPADAAAPAQTPAPLARDAFAPNKSKEQAPAREDRRERAATFADNKPQEPAAKLEDTRAKATLDAAQTQQKNAIASAAPAAAAPAAPAAEQVQKTTRLAAAPLEIVSPNASQRWRVQPGGIERSEDGGRTWVIVRPAAGEVITGGVAPTGSICWLIGRSGIVLVTADGSTFARVPLPEAIDLASVTATDARGATVTTVDGRRFQTDDSGRTWRQN